MNTNKTPKLITSGLIAACLGLTLVGCSASDSSKTKAQKVEQAQASAGLNALLRDQPVPVFQYSQERANLIDAETARANGAASTTFFFNLGATDPYFSCPSIGSPIPATMSLTNPLQTEIHNGSTGGGNTVIEQADPTGTYAGTTSATWVMCVGGNGSIIPQYAEPNAHAVFAPAHWDYTKHVIVVDGPASMKFTAPKK